MCCSQQGAGDDRVGHNRDVRRSKTRMNRREHCRQDAVSSKGVERAGRAQDISAYIPECGNRRARQKNDRPDVSEKTGGRFGQGRIREFG